MKRFVVNVFATTGISLLILSIVALCYNAEYLCITTVFQVLGANFIVHLWLLLFHKFELKYPIFEMTIEVLFIIVTLLVVGAIFQWFTSTPILVLITMGIVTYAISLILNVITMKQEAQKINLLIKKRNKDLQKQPLL
ncbi:MAG: DUF3021 family protein [Clostridiales bacterium]|nr:DUF3021 family protein [Clostridiales bacterium]